MHGSNCGPIFDPHQQGPGANHVVERCARLRQRGADDLETPARLRRRITDTDVSSIDANGRRAGDRDQVADAHRTRKPDLRLVGTAAGDQLAHGAGALLTASRASSAIAWQLSYMQLRCKCVEQLNVPGISGPLQIQPSVTSPTTPDDCHALNRLQRFRPTFPSADGECDDVAVFEAVL